MVYNLRFTNGNPEKIKSKNIGYDGKNQKAWLDVLKPVGAQYYKGHVKRIFYHRLFQKTVGARAPCALSFRRIFEEFLYFFV